MTMQQALSALSEQLTDLDQALDHLSWAIVQDQPPTGGGSSPVGSLDDLVQAMRGWVKEAQGAIALESLPVAGMPYLPQVRRSLVACQRYCLQVADLFHEQLLSPENESALRGLARGQEPDWQRWAHGVRDALEQCRRPLHGVNQGLVQCWQEVSELTDPHTILFDPTQATPVAPRPRFNVAANEGPTV
jgi:hypothetical protein